MDDHDDDDDDDDKLIKNILTWIELPFASNELLYAFSIKFSQIFYREKNILPERSNKEQRARAISMNYDK